MFLAHPVSPHSVSTETFRPQSFLLLIALACTLSACGAGKGSSETHESLLAAPSPTAVITQRKQYDRETLSCNPFGGDDPLQSDLGLFAKLYYIPPGAPQPSVLAPYFSQGVEHPANLFFNQLNVPTRMWSTGFPTVSGDILKSNTGASLFEWFALRFHSRLRIGPNSHPGKYQLAILGDDGVILRLDQDGNGFKDFINGDGTHPTKLVCADHSVRLDSHSLLPMELDYFQGPRYHIALVMLWREIPPNVDETIDPAVLNESLCGSLGNDRWFNPNLPGSPAQADFLSLLNDGWEVIPAENFVLPTTDPDNPCCQDCGIGV